MRTADWPRSRRWRRPGCRPTTAPPEGSRPSTSCAPSPTTCARSSTSPPCARSRWWPTPPTAWGASWCPRCSTASRSSSRCSTASSTAPFRTIRPIRSSRRTCATSRRGCSRWGPTSGSRSTATPTGCSSSTRPVHRCRARPRRRSSPPACSTSTPAPRSSTTASARRRCPRWCASAAARRCAPRWGTASSRR